MVLRHPLPCSCPCGDKQSTIWSCGTPCLAAAPHTPQPGKPAELLALSASSHLHLTSHVLTQPLDRMCCCMPVCALQGLAWTCTVLLIVPLLGAWTCIMLLIVPLLGAWTCIMLLIVPLPVRAAGPGMDLHRAADCAPVQVGPARPCTWAGGCAPGQGCKLTWAGVCAYRTVNSFGLVGVHLGRAVNSLGLAGVHTGLLTRLGWWVCTWAGLSTHKASQCVQVFLSFLVRCSPFLVHYSPFLVRCSPFLVRCSPFLVRCSPFLVRCSPTLRTVLQSR